MSELIPSLDTRYVSSLYPGRLWGFMGDSFTASTGASNGIYSFVQQASLLAGPSRFQYLMKGVGGENTQQMLARFKTDIIDTGCQGVVIQGLRNDVGQGVPTATSIANITAMIALARSAGIPAIVMTAPPCASNSANLAQTLRLTEAINLWIKIFVPRLGALVCDMHAALIDPATGYMNTAYSNGDNTPHPNDLGHLVIAEALAPVMLTRQSSAFSLVDSIGISDSVLLSNPLMAGAIASGVRPSGWFAQATASGAVTRSIIAKPSSFVNGQAYQIQVDGTSAAASITEAAGFNASNFSLGDKVALTFRMEIEDVAGNWRANRTNQTTKTGNARVQIVQNGAYKTFIVPTGALIVGQPQWYTWTVDNLTNCACWYAPDAPVGMNFKAKLGECQVFNLTRLGLDAIL